MTTFVTMLADSVDGYIALQHSLGYQFRKQAASLHAFLRYVRAADACGPLSQTLALDYVMASCLTPNGRAIRYAVIRRFAEYHAAFDPRTEALDRRALPRSRAIPPPRILSEEELGSLMAASQRISGTYPLRGRTLTTVIGLLASTGLRSGEALRLDRSDVDLSKGVLQIRKTKFRKDRLVPVHVSTLTALQGYVRHRDLVFPAPKTPAFFISTRGTRLSSAGLYYGFEQACALAGVNAQANKRLRPHDLRHRFAVTRLAEWHRQKIDVQSMLPQLATYLGHTRYSDTAYYITATSELLGLAAASAFGDGGAAQ
jgi:integrase